MHSRLKRGLCFLGVFVVVGLLAGGYYYYGSFRAFGGDFLRLVVLPGLFWGLLAALCVDGIVRSRLGKVSERDGNDAWDNTMEQ